MLTSIIAFVIILGTLVLIHETGHFLVAKRCGVWVVRFSIGYPPKVVGIHRGETEYAIGATPFGGYVRMLGDEVGSDELGPAEAQTYLTEVSHYLGRAAENAAAADSQLKRALQTQPETRQIAVGDVHADSAASETTGPDQLVALTRVMDASPDPERLLRRILGRVPRQDERDLLDEVQRRKSSEEAIKFLAEHRPPGLTGQVEKRSFPTQSLIKRFAIVLAGPTANIVLAPILLAIVFMYGVPKLLPVVGELQKGMPAAKAGLSPGDRIISINGTHVDSWDDLSTAIKQSKGVPLHLDLKRTTGKAGHSADAQQQGAGTEIETLTITPVHITEPGSIAGAQWMIGVQPRGDNRIERESPFVAIPHAVAETGRMSVMLVEGIAKIITGETPVRQALGGPIMIAQMAGHEARQGLANVLMFTVMLTLELGIINLLPIPMLDGGHLFFFVLEGLRGRPLKLRHREIALQVGLFFLVMLMAFVIFNDISRIVQG
jgi:regulator of sigma E protease